MADTRMITFALGRHRFAIPIEDIREVINIDSVVNVPGGETAPGGDPSLQGRFHPSGFFTPRSPRPGA